MNTYNPNLIKKRELAQMLGKTIYGIDWLIRSRQVPFVRLSARSIRFDVQEIQKWIEANKSEAQ